MNHTKMIILFLFFVILPITLFAQVKQTDYFVPGDQAKELMIIVHVWGEVNAPGKFIVRDGTNLIDIISEAKGPTRYANLKMVYVAHKGDHSEHVVKYNLETYIEKELFNIPQLSPGDVIVVKRSLWGLGLDLGQITGQLAVILNTILILISLSGQGWRV